MASEMLEAIHRMRAGGDFRSPHPSAGWFKLADFSDAVKRCAVCKRSHLFSPTKAGYWSEEEFVCLHCDDEEAVRASTDQGVYIGKNFVEYGQAQYEWKEKCSCCRTEFFYERSTLADRTDKQKARDTDSPIYRHRSGKMKNTTLKYLCDRCDGTTGPLKDPTEFGYMRPPNWSVSLSAVRPPLSEEKPACKPRIVFKPPVPSGKTRPEPVYPTKAEKKVLLKKATEKVEKLVAQRNAKIEAEEAFVASGKTGPRRPTGPLTPKEIKLAQMRAAGTPRPKGPLPPSQRPAITITRGGFEFTWEKFSPWPWMRADQKRVEREDPETREEFRKLLKLIASEKAAAELEKAQNKAYTMARIEAEEANPSMWESKKYAETFLKAYNAEMNRIYAIGRVHEPFEDFRKVALEKLLAARAAKSAGSCATPPKKAGGSGPRSRGYRVADGRKVEPSTP